MPRRRRAHESQLSFSFPVSADQVLFYAARLQDGWTTSDIAQQIMSRERKVRPAVGWLLQRGLIERYGTGDRSKRRFPHWSARYAIVREQFDCDVGLLNRIFMHA